MTPETLSALIVAVPSSATAILFAVFAVTLIDRQDKRDQQRDTLWFQHLSSLTQAVNRTADLIQDHDTWERSMIERSERNK